MKLKTANQSNQGLTLVEVAVIITVLTLLAAILIPMLAATHRRSSRIDCVINLKHVSIASQIWEDGHNHEYPMSYTSTNGALEWPATTNLAVYFRAMSNEITSPKFLICPADRKHIPATNWTTDFNNSHISYFLNLDASEAFPQMIMSGDDNLAIDGVPVKSGLQLLSPPASVSWTAERHGGAGNLGFADGSVAEVSASGLQNALVLATNGTPVTADRIVVP